ncbi:MAG: flagellin [Cyanobacteria bacterium REEB65]|nr:flagellin [Cyanobacteria bacterium REEB65]
MSLRINTNLAAMDAHRLLQVNDQALSTSLERLSSGLRINHASDDAAGLAISQKMQAQVNGLNQASSNAQDAINLLQTADGALSETENILQRMRELSIEGANDTLTASDRANISDEMNQLSAEVDRIATTTQFNSADLLNGSASGVSFTFQIGANAGDVLNITIGSATASALGVLTTQLSVDTAADASTTIGNLDSAIQDVSSLRAKIGANVNRLQHTVANLNVASENMSASLSSIQDLDMAAEASNLTREQILSQSSQAMLAQANQAPQSILQLLH